MKTLSSTLRPFTKKDYPALTALLNAVYHEYPITETEVRSWDTRRDPNLVCHRVVLEREDKLIGVAVFEHLSWIFHPQKFSVEINVYPEYQSQGFGTELYQQLMTDLKKHKPLILRTRTREDMLSGVAFAKKHGFTEETRDFESRLDPNTLSFAELDQLKAKLKTDGISFMRLSEYIQTEPEYQKKLYDLDVEISKDVPFPEGETHTTPSFDSWVKGFFENPNFKPEAHLLAMYQGEALGFNSFWPTKAEPGCIYNGLTGVKKAFRHKGIAKALKLENLKWAKEQGYTVVKTWNNTRNKGMLAINESLGFFRQPAWIIFKKELANDI